MGIKIAPLNSSFMLIAILGFLISVVWVKGISTEWSIAFALVFGLMFIASVISMTYGPADTELIMDELAKKKKNKKKKK